MTIDHAAIRERLAKCPRFGHEYEPGQIGTGCAVCGLTHWIHWYAEDVAALLAEIDGRDDG